MKQEFRKKCLELRDNLSKINLDDKILALEEYKRAETVFIYISYKSEVDTGSLIKASLKEKIVLVPYCIDKNGNMVASRIDSFCDLKEGMYGILEPENLVEYKGKIDASIIPGVAFSKDGYRIGYGKGYYDRFLSKNATFSIGLSYDELLFDSIPHSKLDYKMNYIITPKKEIRI